MRFAEAEDALQLRPRPVPIIDQLVSDLTQIMAEPAMREAFDKAGSSVLAEGPGPIRAQLVNELAMYKQSVDEVT